jgi:hypothetical protein
VSFTYFLVGQQVPESRAKFQVLLELLDLRDAFGLQVARHLNLATVTAIKKLTKRLVKAELHQTENQQR